MSGPPTAASALASRSRPSSDAGYWRRSWQRLARDRVGVAAGCVLLIVVVLAFTGPLLSSRVLAYSPTQQILNDQFADPGPRHWLGADQFGRDTLTRLIYGAQVSLSVAALTTIIALSLGTAIGLTAGYYGGRTEAILMRLMDVLLAIPPLFLFILLAMLFRPNTLSLAVILASTGWLHVARLVRGEALTIKHLDFILAARSTGATNARLMLRHVLPGVMPVLVVAASVTVGTTILSEAALGFLGLGIQPPTPTWGNMIADAQYLISHTLYPLLFPGIAIFVSVLAVNVFGNAARDALDPRLS